MTLRAFMAGYLTMALTLLIVAQSASIRVTWTQSERTIKVKGRTVVSILP